MYSYQDKQKYQVKQINAIIRSLGEGNPNIFQENQINNMSSINNERRIGQNWKLIHEDQSLALYWMYSLILEIFQIIFIILIGCY